MLPNSNYKTEHIFTMTKRDRANVMAGPVPGMTEPDPAALDLAQPYNLVRYVLYVHILIVHPAILISLDKWLESL